MPNAQLIAAVHQAREQRLLSAEAADNLVRWLTEPAYRASVPEIAALIHSQAWDVLEDGFYTVLPFGTGGRRGPRGVGPNRINARTIAESARGLADWTIQHHGPNSSIVIAYDTRHASTELSRVCAEVVAASGLTAYLYDGFRPTPQLSFTVRLLEAGAGIVISASHNPRSDNGFKAYGPDGGQLVPPVDAEVMDAVERTMGKDIPRLPLEEGVRQGCIRMLGEREDVAYRSAVLSTSRSTRRAARIVYTPLHGAGIRSVLPILHAAGFEDVHLVEAQSEPDGDFPNVRNNIPNPEEPAALAEAAELAAHLGADIAIGTDPDADRLGCVAKRVSSDQTWDRLTGNQIGALLCHYVLSELSRQGRLRPDNLVLTTTVTSPMIGKLARFHGAGVIEDLLVGFKYVACVMADLPDPGRVVFACEESHGYLGGSYTRDKDGAGAALLLAEATARAREEGGDLWRTLDRIFEMVGYHCDLMYPHLSPGKSGMEHIARMLAGLRASTPRSLGSLDVLRVTDRLDGTVYDVDGNVIGRFEPITDPATGVVLQGLLPATDNLLVYDLAGTGSLAGVRAAVRPSGTEPKCKFYASGWTLPGPTSPATRRQVDAQTQRVVDELLAYALAVAETG